MLFVFIYLVQKFDVYTAVKRQELNKDKEKNYGRKIDLLKIIDMFI